MGAIIGFKVGEARTDAQWQALRACPNPERLIGSSLWLTEQRLECRYPPPTRPIIKHRRKQ